MVLRPISGIETETLLSAPPSAARVTVPDTVPVSCAAAGVGTAKAARVVSRENVKSRRLRRGADELRRIPGILWLEAREAARRAANGRHQKLSTAWG
jgi:hypothetical protein